MKRVSIVLLSILFLVLMPEVIGAQESTDTQLNEDEIRLAHQQMLELAEQGKEDQIDHLFLVKKYRELFRQDKDLLKEYLDNLDSLNPEKLNQAIEQGSAEVSMNSNDSVKTGSDIIVLEDGSFLISEYVDSPVISIGNGIGLYSTVTHSYGTRVTTHNYKRPHLGFPDTGLVLKTTYDLTSSGIEIVSASTAGTTAIFPVIVNRSAKVLTKEATTKGAYASSQGDYKLNYLGTNGIALFSEDFTILTRYKFSSVNKSKKTVSYSISKNVQY